MQEQTSDGVLQQFQKAKEMICNNPQQFYNQLMQNDPQFSKFVQDIKGMSPEEVAKKYNVNPIILRLLR